MMLPRGQRTAQQQATAQRTKVVPGGKRARGVVSQRTPVCIAFVVAAVELIKRMATAPAQPHNTILMAALLFTLPAMAAFCSEALKNESVESLESAKNPQHIHASEFERHENRVVFTSAVALAGFFSAAWISPALGALLVTGAQLYYFSRSKLCVEGRTVVPTDGGGSLKHTSLMSSVAALLTNISPVALSCSVMFLALSVFSGSVLPLARIML